MSKHICNLCNKEFRQKKDLIKHFNISKCVSNEPPKKFSYLRDPSSSNTTTYLNQSTDVIVVGSGPGASGFIQRYLELNPHAKIRWFEAGDRNNVTIDWPVGLTTQINGVPKKIRSFSSVTRGLRWNVFGGGMAGNSGGPLMVLRNEQFQNALDMYGPRVIKQFTQSIVDADPVIINKYERHGIPVKLDGFVFNKPNTSGSIASQFNVEHSVRANMADILIKK